MISVQGTICGRVGLKWESKGCAPRLRDTLTRGFLIENRLLTLRTLGPDAGRGRDADVPWGWSIEWFNRLTETVSPTGGRK